MRENIEGARLNDIVLGKSKHDRYKKTLGAAFTIPDDVPDVIFIDPTAARTVTLPDKSKRTQLIIVNAADAAEVITLIDDDVSSVTAGALTQSEIAFCYTEGVKWYVVVGVA